MRKLKFLLGVIACCMFTVINANAGVMPVIAGNSVYRTDIQNATIRFLSNTSGTAYYKITSTSTVPSDVVTGGTSLDVTKDTTASISLTDLSIGPKYVHIVVKPNENLLSNVLTVAMPFDNYYFDDFEAYVEETAVPTTKIGLTNVTPQLHIWENAVGTGSQNQKVIKDSDENKVLNTIAGMIGLDTRTKLTPSVIAGYIVYQAKVKNLGNHNILQYGTLTFGGDIQNETRHVLAGANRNNSNHTFGFLNNNGWENSSTIVELNKTYKEKIVFNVEEKEYDFYVDNEKINTIPIKAKDYNSIEWFGVYNGGGTSYYDDVEMYITDEYNCNVIKGSETNGKFEIDKTSASYGETVEILNISPNASYRLKEIKILNSSDNSDVTSIVNYNSTTKRFTMPNFEVKVNVEFEVIPYIITVNSVTGATISPTGTINVKHGDNQDISVTANLGYRITSVKVNGIEKEIINNKVALTSITEDKEVVVTVEKIPFTITVNSVTGATITPNGTINVLYGDNKEITITANLGYKLKSVKVNDEEKLPLTENKLTLTNITEDQEVVVLVEKIEYDVTNGDGQKHIIGKNDDAIFRIDADKNLFLKAYLNGEELDSAFYTVTEGSTIITLKQDFLNNLLPGTYNLRTTFSDGGEANATFVIAQPAENNPKTGDRIMISIIIGSISLIGLLGISLYLKKKRFN